MRLESKFNLRQQSDIIIVVDFLMMQNAWVLCRAMEELWLLQLVKSWR